MMPFLVIYGFTAGSPHAVLHVHSPSLPDELAFGRHFVGGKSSPWLGRHHDGCQVPAGSCGGMLGNHGQPLPWQAVSMTEGKPEPTPVQRATAALD
jgi:hypothetical protein